MVQQGAQLKVSCDPGVIQGLPGQQCIMQAEDSFHIWSINVLSGTDSLSAVDVLEEYPQANAATATTTAGHDAQISISSSNEHSHPSLVTNSFTIDPSTSATVAAVPVCNLLPTYTNIEDYDSQSTFSSIPSSPPPPRGESPVLSLNMDSQRRQTRSRLDDATFQLAMQGCEQHQEDSKEREEEKEQPIRVLQSILKKTRPILSHRHPIHSYLDSMLQYQHQYQQQTLTHFQKPQQLQHQKHSPHNHQQLCLSASLLNIDHAASSTELRPLPTPPAVKSVRWASHDEVVEIENVDDLLELGYFDDHDSDFEWDGQNDSWSDLDESGTESEDEKESVETGYPLGLYHNQYQHQVYAQEEDEEESLIAEDELIQRLSAQSIMPRTSFTSQPPHTQQPQEPKRLTANTDAVNIATASMAPQLDRQKILAEVAERKRNGVGAFARRSEQDAAIVGESSGTASVTSSSSSSLHSFPTFSAGSLATSLTRGESQEYVHTPPPMRITTNVSATLRTGMRTSPDIMMERWKQDRYRFRSGTSAMDPSKVDVPVAAPHRDPLGSRTTRAAKSVNVWAYSAIPNSTNTATGTHSPLTGLFAVNKPTGITSTTIVDYLQHVCKCNRTHPFVEQVLKLDESKRAKRGLVKIGHGGTLDPLARGVVVVGMGSGCKKLHGMSASSKVYIAEGRLGFSTTTLDSTGSLIEQKPTDHVTKDSLMQVLNAFKGKISQTPPLYSALSMDGKRLYDYARENLPLPREIPTREIQIYSLDLLSFPDSNTVPDPNLCQHGFLNGNVQSVETSTPASPGPIQRLELPNGFKLKPFVHDPNHKHGYVPIPSTPKGLFFHIRVHCSSGTYIRTLIADIAAQLGTVGHMTDLLRVEQSGFKLGDAATLEFDQCDDIEVVADAIRAGNKIQEA
ncbi:hypothetical protein BG011_001744 [Mortierella polycephala]|uniref:tRNA pseudouridine(55) synthase n=1 Tax=Mortierella polycephala TaxID=41804 RepID=A0A9P6U5M7_9FUNG|nr:hypothetical protein BG011_001744 [Mortierella polycephala]